MGQAQLFHQVAEERMALGEVAHPPQFGVHPRDAGKRPGEQPAPDAVAVFQEQHALVRHRLLDPPGAVRAADAAAHDRVVDLLFHKRSSSGILLSPRLRPTRSLHRLQPPLDGDRDHGRRLVGRWCDHQNRWPSGVTS
jgi:hypothetical protein